MIKIYGEQYDVLDALNNITLADSFVKNKIGSGHGEAKLYVGNEGTRYEEFFDDLSRDFFFLGDDFKKYLQDAGGEYNTPQQDYVRKDDMPGLYQSLKQRVSKYSNRKLTFNLYKVDVQPPRVYLNSKSKYYDLMRSIGLPNISYLSIMKVKNDRGVISYYCRIFIDYRSDILKYESPELIREKMRIQKSSMSEGKKERLSAARIGQGEYRRKLLEDCECCPFTLVNDERLLIASHIKPWVASNDQEKIDSKNGFALTPTYDKLFDQGYITFNSDFTVRVSPWISPMNQKRLHIYDNMKLEKLEKQLDAKREKYLKYHRENVFKS